MISSDGSFLPLFSRPIALVLLAVGVAMAFLPMIRSQIAKKKARRATAETKENN